MRLLVLVFFVSTAAWASGEVEIVRDLAYGDDPKLNALDVYRPKDAHGLPVLVFVHGGGWSEGDKGNHPRKGTFFAKQGFVYVTVNYRLSPKVKHPAHVEDLARALGWVHQHIGEYGGDPSRILLLGHSAGAHLAALVVTDPRYLQKYAVEREAVRGVALLDGSGYDLERRVPRSRGWMRQMLVTAFGEDPRVWKDASPLLHISRGEVLPPFLVFHISDRPAAKAQAEELARALTEAGGKAQVVPVTGRNHVTINRRLALDGDPVAPKLLEFFKAQATPDIDK